MHQKFVVICIGGFKVKKKRSGDEEKVRSFARRGDR